MQLNQVAGEFVYLFILRAVASLDKNWLIAAIICGNNRVVFNIAGNKYRLVVEIQYRAGTAWVKFVGTHAQYDQINVESVNEY